MRSVSIAILCAALVFTGAPGCSENDSPQSSALDAQRDTRTSTPVAFDLFDRDDEEATRDVAAGPTDEGGVERAVFWRTESGIPEAQPTGIPTSFADLAERVAPAVVSIQTSGTVDLGAQPMLPPGFEEFFGGGPFGPHVRPDGGPGGGRKHKSSGEGSGFVISADGYIVTNNHVVENMDEITARFKDGSKLEAKVIGRDPKTDIALLKVEPKGKTLETIALGDSDAIRAGDWVVAIGNPFGLEHTVTAGIISAKHRRDVSDESYEDFIQTDAAINPGNSGGPLIDLQGRVVGINTAIRSDANTIGFSVPINQAKEILPQLKADGRVTRGWLGVQIQEVTEPMAEQFGLKEARGALVSQILPDTPAADAGIERGDVIVEFDGQPIGEWRDLPIVVAQARVEKEAKVVVMRDGKRKELRVQVGRLPDDEQLAANEPQDEGAGAFGLRLQDLTPALAEQLGIEDAEGVLVADVDPAGPAAESGIRRGDVIVEFDRAPVDSAEALARKLGATKKSALLLVRRGENTLYVPVERRE
ncbi:MAG: DegQ family serine endoprotease [Deltaproteobacteria bacterium]|nr:DegQ family serine endoprotease [Deltaproteobacteria bacterium]